MCKERQRRKVIIPDTVNPQIIETIHTYLDGTDMEVVSVPAKEGQADISELAKMIDGETACVLIQQPNFFGLLEEGDAIGALLEGSEVKYIMSCNPISLGVLKAPAEYGVDIAVGEGQPLGLPLSFGGPYLGFMATTSKLMRRLPGRVVGETKDAKGERAFVLTLQAREQHIRREKASSNICSNQALCAMTAAVYLAAMGKKGLRQAAESSMSKAHYLAECLCGLPGYRRVYQGEFFNEFVTTVPGSVSKILSTLEQHGILGGYPLEDNPEGEYPSQGGISREASYGKLLWCATELNTREEIDYLIEVLKEVGIS